MLERSCGTIRAWINWASGGPATVAGPTPQPLGEYDGVRVCGPLAQVLVLRYA